MSHASSSRGVLPHDEAPRGEGAGTSYARRTKQVQEAQTFDTFSPQIKQDIMQMILQYMQDEGYTASVMTIQDEANVKLVEHKAQRTQLKRMHNAILEGDWIEVEKVATKAVAHNHKSFLYAMHRQQFLELIEGGEYQKAFTHLTKRLKPLEACAPSLAEFKDLCYLLTCKSVQEVVPDWDLVTAREQLVEQHRVMVEFESAEQSGGAQVPSRRLVRLLQQAAAYQIEFSHYHPRAGASVQVKSLLEDYSCSLLPNAVHSELLGHAAGVKCLAWVGTEGLLASGSNDASIRLWSVQKREQPCVGCLQAHASRVWQLSASPCGRRLASASADGTVRLWDTRAALNGSTTPTLTLSGHTGDVFTVQLHPAEPLVLSAGYDATVRLFDLNKGEALKTLHGHKLLVSSAVFNAAGNLIVSGGKASRSRA